MCKTRRMSVIGLVSIMLLAISGCATGGIGGNTNKAPQWKLGVQAYTFREFTLFETIDKTKELGLEYIEAWPKQRISSDLPDVVFSYDIPNNIRDKVKRKLAETGIKLVSYGMVRPTSDEAEARKLFDFADYMGIQNLTAEPKPEPDTLDLLDRLAQKYGINVAIHNHPRNPKKPNYLFWNPDEVAKIIAGRSSRIGACPDLGHWARSGIDTVEGLKKLKGRIITVHLKDPIEPTPEARDVPIGTGVANIIGALAELARQNFAGAMIIEYEHNPTDNMDDVAQCVKYFHQVARELGR